MLNEFDPSDPCEFCTIPICEEGEGECWLDMSGTQDEQDLWATLAQKYLKVRENREYLSWLKDNRPNV